MRSACERLLSAVKQLVPTHQRSFGYVITADDMVQVLYLTVESDSVITSVQIMWKISFVLCYSSHAIDSFLTCFCGY